ncbi:MAG: hypothetical protein AABW88_03320 [Nanoarchaeota archaeon]
MEKEVKFLKDWAVRYIKNKDIITKKIISLKENDNDFVVTRESEHKYVVVPYLKEIKEIIKEIKKFEHGKTLICFHTKSNFNFLIENWNEFVELGRYFLVYFVNPFSKLDRVLSICPYTHQLISDEESLKLGLNTMAETVEFTTEEEIKKIVNS